MTKAKLENGAGKRFPAKQWEEHYSVCQEPGGQYLTHFSPDDESAAGVSRKLLDFLFEHGVDKTLQVIGGDSTNVNTGYKVRIIKKVIFPRRPD